MCRGNVYPGSSAGRYYLPSCAEDLPNNNLSKVHTDSKKCPADRPSMEKGPLEDGKAELSGGGEGYGESVKNNIQIFQKVLKDT